jgi:rhodanese-related sulfurtransferase
MDPHFDGVLFKTYAAELARRLRFPAPPFRVLDVRPREDYERGHIAGALHVTPAQLAAGLPEWAQGRVELFVVGSGPDDGAVREASLALLRHGAHRIVEFTGGMFEWKRAGRPVSSNPAARAAA